MCCCAASPQLLNDATGGMGGGDLSPLRPPQFGDMRDPKPSPLLPLRSAEYSPPATPYIVPAPPPPEGVSAIVAMYAGVLVVGLKLEEGLKPGVEG